MRGGPFEPRLDFFLQGISFLAQFLLPILRRGLNHR